MSPLPEIGQLVHVRQRRYLVEDVTPPPTGGDATLLRLSGVDDDAQGQPLQVLWEHELDADVLSGEAWQTLGERGFDPADRFSAYLHTLRWNCLTATDPNRFQAPFRAGIRLEAYQLEPLRKALQLPRVNLFIADDVGLGKTIEAGLIARELLLRKKVRDLVVACPPSMLLQWQDELETRFGLTFRILDKTYLTQTRQARGFGVNPWTTHNRFLISQRLLIDETYTAPLRDWLGEFRPGTLLILDEAHHAAPASGARYAIDSKITRAIRDLAPRFEHRLFLSATPHNGHSNSFSALLELLDPQRFCRGVAVRKGQLDAVMVRRLKEDLRGAGVPGFCQREVKQIDIGGLPQEAPELALSRLLNQYRELRERRLQKASRRQQAASGLLLVGLQQRLLSSIEAFARTLKVHRRTVQKQWDAAQIARAAAESERLELLATPVGNDDEAATLPPDDLQSEEDAQTEAATVASATPEEDAAAFAEELRVLERMAEIADTARHQPDARLKQLLAWIQRQMCPGGRWNPTRVILFTEYEDTLRYVRDQLEAALAQTDRAEERLAIYRGSTSAEEREAIQRAFNTAPDAHPVRILLATDAAREGLNLQAHCANLFHLDVPWNPGRIEQRNGRIDRKLQPQPVVYCHYFYYAQRLEDRILATLIRKIATIQQELGSLSPVVEGRLAELLRGGIRHADLARLDRELNAADSVAPDQATVAEELDVARDRQQALEAQINTLRTRLERSQKQINFQEEPFRAALSAALQMQKVPTLEPVTATPGQFTVPAETLRKDPTWAATLDTLRVPRSREQNVWQWRKEAPLRPVVFEAPATLDDTVVHLHLEHRVAQRLLGRFTAQGFIHHDLSRACLAQSRDAIPRIILLGRLCLYGPQAARLHEELLAVTARWLEPSQRQEPLKPYAREAESKTLDLLEAALSSPQADAVHSTIQARLREILPQDLADLLPHLQQRGEVLARETESQLQQRGAKEAREMRAILEEQQKRLAETARKYQADSQLTLGFNEEEQRQLEANRRHWDKRLNALAGELEREPARIREVYAVRATRLEPVGLVYLWPVTG
ncbi:MAG: DISARM system SNF2-like helicase DrmD [Candidatus Competibacteraceae bacterium]|nr:DISARM system SNF2-like helicase DrmD [Candidatus Competibacteraceae bacterium]HRY14942.1 DISARM system SNF2-like helicase DrmD [Candidatus Competibacteraceae bacterium]